VRELWLSRLPLICVSCLVHALSLTHVFTSPHISPTLVQGRELEPHSERTLMLFDATPIAPPPAPPAPVPQERERQEKQDNSQDFSRTRRNVVETTMTGEPLVKEVTTIEREYVVDDDEESVSSYSTCSACEHHQHHHQTVVHETAPGRSDERSQMREEVLEDGTRVRTIQRQRTVTRRRMQDGVQIGPKQSTTYESIETYEMGSDGTWHLVRAVPVPPQTETILPGDSLNATYVADTHFASRQQQQQQFNDSRTSVLTSTPLRPSANTTSVLSQPPVDLSSLKDGHYVYETTQPYERVEPASMPMSAPSARTTELRAGPTSIDEEMSRAHQRRVTQRRYVNGQEVGPPVVRTSFSEEHLHRDPATGAWVRDNLSSRPLADRPLASAQPSPASAAAGPGGSGSTRVTFAEMPPAAPGPDSDRPPPRFGPAGSSYNLLGQGTAIPVTQDLS
jgi:hypothetical protein